MREVKDNIESLDPRSHIRLRKGMYIGDSSTPNQLLLEIFSNALDMHTAGFGKQINVSIADNGVCQIEDRGNGFPINELREDGETTLQASFDVTNTSGKFSNEGLYAGTALGLNGLGSKLTNFLSSWLEVISWQKGKYEHIWFKDGIFEKRETGGWKDKKCPSGTTVTYKPDPQFFDTDKTDAKYFNEFFNDICCLCPELTIVFSSSLGQNVKISHPKGIEDLIDRRIKNNIELIDNRLVISEKIGDSKFDLALSFTGNSSATIIPYVNFGLTNIGPHITGIKSTITRIINAWAKENGILKKTDKNLEGSSIQEGMLLVCNIVTTNVEYNAQVKTSIVKIDSSFVNSILAKELELWLDQNPDDAHKILEKAIVARKAAEAAKKARAAVKEKATTETKPKKVLNLPSKLADAYGTNREKCELYIVEGDSAAGNLKDARNNEWQGVLPVRGKIINTQKATLDKIMKNAEIVDMIKAFGLKVSANGKKIEYKKENIRYGKIIIMSDADVDGAHIKNLFYTFVWNFAPQLFEDGFIYAGIPPLFRLKNNKEVVYIKDDAELEEFKKKNDISKWQVARLKGLGEMSADETEECLIDPETRMIKQVTVEDIGKADILFDQLMGTKADARKKFIEKNSEKVSIYV